MGYVFLVLACLAIAAIVTACSHVRNFDPTEERIIQTDRDIAKLKEQRQGLLKAYKDEHGTDTPLSK